MPACKKSSKKGFTLVELLVVISIIAILSVIGMTIFGGVQRSARDARRIGDINTIAKAMAVHYGECAVGKYCNLKNEYFTSGAVPSDPTNGLYKCGTGNTWYCAYCMGSEGAMHRSNPNAAFNGCTASLPNAEQPAWWDTFAQVNAPGGSGYYYSSWELCANLEGTSNGKPYYCIHSQQ